MEEKTNYQVSISESEGIVEIVIAGEVTKNTIDRLHDEVINILKAGNAKAVLCDIRDLKGPTDEITDAYFRVRSLPPEVIKLPAAVVEQSENEAYQTFYETTAANVGQPIKWFKEIESARAWLKSKL